MVPRHLLPCVHIALRLFLASRFRCAQSCSSAMPLIACRVRAAENTHFDMGRTNSAPIQGAVHSNVRKDRSFRCRKSGGGVSMHYSCSWPSCSLGSLMPPTLHQHTTRNQRTSVGVLI